VTTVILARAQTKPATNALVAIEARAINISLSSVSYASENPVLRRRTIPTVGASRRRTR
jgi:hypothetical protein